MIRRSLLLVLELLHHLVLALVSLFRRGTQSIAFNLILVYLSLLKRKSSVAHLQPKLILTLGSTWMLVHSVSNITQGKFTTDIGL